MIGAATILIVLPDFSIPGTERSSRPARYPLAAREARFFSMLRRSKPDVIVLDVSRQNKPCVATVFKIRQNTTIPILVVCNPNHCFLQEYKIAGAAECISSPIDLREFSETIQMIIKITRQIMPPVGGIPAFSFEGLTFDPNRNLVVDAAGNHVELTDSENRALLDLVSHAWVLRTRTEIAAVLYAPRRRAGHRAVDVVITRLRRKLESLCGAGGVGFIKTEFRRGYILVANVVPSVSGAPAALSRVAALG